MRDVRYVGLNPSDSTPPSPVREPGIPIGWIVVGIVWSFVAVIWALGCAPYVEPPHPAFEALSRHCHAVTPARQADTLEQHPAVIDSAVFDRCMEKEKP